MADFKDIQGALIDHWVDSALGISTAYENSKFSPVEGTPWARLTILPSQPEIMTLGPSGEDEHLGILQIDLYYPTDEGNSPVLTMADSIRTAYKAGTSLSYNGQSVVILNCGRSGGELENGYFKIMLNVAYRARTTR